MSRLKKVNGSTYKSIRIVTSVETDTQREKKRDGWGCNKAMLVFVADCYM